MCGACRMRKQKVEENMQTPQPQPGLRGPSGLGATLPWGFGGRKAISGVLAASHQECHRGSHGMAMIQSCSSRNYVALQVLSPHASIWWGFRIEDTSYKQAQPYVPLRRCLHSELPLAETATWGGALVDICLVGHVKICRNSHLGRNSHVGVCLGRNSHV